MEGELIVYSFDIFRFWVCDGCVADVSPSRWVIAGKVRPEDSSPRSPRLSEQIGVDVDGVPQQSQSSLLGSWSPSVLNLSKTAFSYS